MNTYPTRLDRVAISSLSLLSVGYLTWDNEV